MSLRRIVSLASLVVIASLSSLVGCTVENDSSGSSGSKITIAGNLPHGSVETKTFGSVDVSNGGAHVSARKLHHRGEVGGSVDVAVDGSGHFELDVARGSRYVITVDDADGHSALVTFANGSSALEVSAKGDAGEVSIGDLSITGGAAQSDVTIDGKWGLAATRAEVDEIFIAANGAILEAQAAYEEAMKAAEEALKEAQLATDEARKAADEAAKAAEEAKKAAGQ